MAQLRAIVDKLLTNVSSAYVPQGYVSEAFFPKLSVVQISGLLGKYSNSHIRIQSSLVAGRGQARRVETITRASTTYLIEQHALEGIVTPDDYRNVEKPFDAERDEVMGLSTAIWLGKEKSLADTLADTTVMTQNTTLAGQAQFNDYANSDPIGTFKTARLAIRNGCGLPPNTAVMDWSVFNTLAYHPAILQALGFTHQRAGQLTEQELCKAMGVEKLLVARAVYNNSKEGQSDNLSAVWGKHIVFAVLPDKAMPYQVSLGYYVTLQDSQPRKVYKYPIYNPPASTGIIVQDHFDMLISNASAGYVIKNAIA